MAPASSPPADPLAIELAALAPWSVGAPPATSEIADVVAGGIPKPPDPRAVSAHAALMRWSQDVLVVAMRAGSAACDADVLAAARELAARLRLWTAYGSDFGDPRDVANYGNASLELTWFMGNVARAADILRRLVDARGDLLAGVWTSADAAAFAAWARAVERRYLAFDVFAAGQSNRKASQLETMMRITVVDDGADPSELSARFAGLEQLLVDAITARGDIPEDTPRDKYHPQFFLASTLQAMALARREGVAWPDDEKGATATAHLAAALRYCADENYDQRLPEGYATIGDAHPNHDIPLWLLARSFLAGAGLASTPEIDEMLTQSYKTPSRYGLVMDWGFAAVAAAFDL